MSEVTVHPVPAEWKARAYIDNDKYLAMYKRSVDDPEGFWREHGEPHRLDQALHQGQERLLQGARRLDQMVRGRQPQHRRQLPRPAS